MSTGKPAWFAARLAWTAAPLSCVASLLVMVLGGVTPAASAWLLRAVLNALAGPPAGAGPLPGPVLALALEFSGLALVTAVAPYARRYSDAELRRRLGLLMQDNLYRAINSFPGMSRFESPRFSDQLQLAQRVASSTGSSFVAAALGLGQSLLNAVTLGLALLAMSPPMTAVVAVSAVPAVLVQLRNSGRQSDLDWRSSPAVRRQLFYGRLLTEQSAAKEARLFGLGDFLRGRMLTDLRAVQRGQRALDRRLVSVEALLSLLSAAISAAGLLWIIARVARHQAPIGDVTLFAAAILGVQAAISSAVMSLGQLAQGGMLLRQYEDLVSMGPDLPLAAAPRPVPPLREGIALRDVWFRYDEAHPWLLRGLDLVIPSGESVALVGLNGAGKSTIVKLLCRFYDPDRGVITWDGTDIRDFDPAELRQRAGTVFQDYMCYDLTAAENIGLGDLARLGDADRIRRAAGLAGAAATMARLPRGYDTLLSRLFAGPEAAEVGVSLSGGQWQRLALARAFMRADRDLLILDEPSSGLDAAAEAAVHRQIRSFRDGRASLLISHRLAAVRDASVIYVVADGTVAERGTHEELLAAAGQYCRLFTTQASGYQDPPPTAGRRATVPTGPGRRGA